MEIDLRAESVADLGRASDDPVAGALLMVAAAIYSLDRTIDRYRAEFRRDEDGYIDLGTGP